MADGERAASMRLVVVASALGTMFEWYDFFVYGTLAGIIGSHFFPAGNETVSLLIALATFGVGFGMRPIGAALFGVLGDRLGRKYTFLATVVLMGGSTAAIGLLPTYATIGIAAPAILVLLRIGQGLALGGEYGGAAVYVAEYAPAHRRGLYTSFIHAGVAGGFLLSLAVVLAANAYVAPAAWTEWGWRLPFLFSTVLLAVSLWVRMLLHESPVFRTMQAEGRVAGNPLRESFDSRAKALRILAVLGVAAGMTVLFYSAQIQSLYFLQNTVRIADTPARLIVGLAAASSMIWYVLFGWLSDHVGRKPPIVVGYVLAILCIFPLHRQMAEDGNPVLAAARARAPVIVTGSDCRYDPFASHGQATPCARILDSLSKRGVAYTKASAAPGVPPSVTIGGHPVLALDDASLASALAGAGYPPDKVVPDYGAAIRVALAIMGLALFSGMTFGPLAAWLVELFPARVRYTSLSIPYNVGTGYFGGFLPFIVQYAVARTGDPFAGLWYVVAVAILSLIVSAATLPETAGRELE
ncbi:MFS transporter [Sphingomonas nostoxanthinifaciens]|uniref:MFS transporter n=1 Tax=Sphingomonas nostoxanthinifaciens TaxID=2872652 RepID=UPI001CC21054|nr:MFS transporter [Sphingomonas nostoxanthinifaciens]UAK24921.1 MFS transporter [Sphingomonas nostoxanthinifaciens]